MYILRFNPFLCSGFNCSQEVDSSQTANVDAKPKMFEMLSG